MKNAPKVLLTIAVLISGWNSPASSQPLNVGVAKQVTGPRDNSTLIAALNPPVKSTAEHFNLPVNSMTPIDRPLTQASALSSFRIAYRNGDHPQSAIWVSRENSGTPVLRLSDAEPGDDPLDAHATWWTFPTATGGEVSSDFDANTEVTFPMAAGPRGTVLVLGGFVIGVVPEPSGGRRGEVRIQRLEVQASQVLVEARINEPAKIRVAVDTDQPGRRLRVRVQYAWVPVSYLQTIAGLPNTVQSGLASNRTTSAPGSSPSSGVLASVGGPERAIANTQSRPVGTDRTILTGFNFQFRNAPLFLRSFGVHLNGQVGAAGDSGEAISWQDQDRNDPIQWYVHYFSLK